MINIKAKSKRKLNRRSYIGENNPNYGKCHTPEAKEKISQANRGCIPWNKGKRGVYSKEVLQKMSDARKDIPAWSRGLTKETDKRLITTSIKLTGKNNPMWGKRHSAEAIARISEAGKGNQRRLGIKHTPESRAKMKDSWHHRRENMTLDDHKRLSLAHSGKKNGRYIHGKGNESYSLKFSDRLKEIVRHRDGYKCQLCGCSELENGKKLSVHHIDYEKENCSLINLITLCRRCNSEVNVNRDYWIGYFPLEVGYALC